VVVVVYFLPLEEKMFKSKSYLILELVAVWSVVAIFVCLYVELRYSPHLFLR
jgi:uncharacterized membrane protein